MNKFHSQAGCLVNVGDFRWPDDGRRKVGGLEGRKEGLAHWNPKYIYIYTYVYNNMYIYIYKDNNSSKKNNDKSNNDDNNSNKNDDNYDK